MSAGKHLTQAEREKIIALAAEGYAMQSIARRFEVGLSCVYHIVQKLGRRKSDAPGREVSHYASAKINAIVRQERAKAKRNGYKA